MGIQETYDKGNNFVFNSLFSSKCYVKNKSINFSLIPYRKELSLYKMQIFYQSFVIRST